MTRFTMIAVAALLTSGTAVGADVEPGPHYMHLKPLEWMIGDWIGKGTLEQDVPGLGMKGDPVQVMVSLKWRANRNVILMESSERIEDRELNSLFITVEWDAKGKQVITSLVNRGGDKWNGTLSFTGGDNHKTTSRVIAADGTVTESMVVVLNRTGKDTMVYTFADGSSVEYKRKK